MQKERAVKLKRCADNISKTFSNPEREKNYNNETFKVEKLVPLSESTAIVMFKKQPTNKYGLCFCYWVNVSGGQWRYFFPTYDHCTGMERLNEYLHDVELKNFSLNFTE